MDLAFPAVRWPKNSPVVRCVTGQTALLHYLEDQRNGEDNAATVAAMETAKSGKSSLVKMKNTKTSSQKTSASKAGATGKVLYVFNNKSNDITSKDNRAVSPSRQTAVNSTSKAPKRREVDKRKSCSLLIRETKR